MALTVTAALNPVGEAKAAEQSLANLDTVWKYLDDNTDPAEGGERTSWTSVDFDDSQWKSSRRKAARRSGIAQCTNMEEGQEHTVCSGEDIEADYFRREMISEISRIIQDLPDKFRVPLILFYLFEFKVEQIAEMTGKPPGTVKSRLFKGRKIVKKRLEEAGYGEERF